MDCECPLYWDGGWKMQKMRIVTMQLGMLATNCYLVINEETGELVIIDPAGEADPYPCAGASMKARPVAVLLTHGHFDHIGAVVSLQKTYSIPVCAMAEEQELLQDAQKNLSGLYGKPVTVQADRFFRDKETVQLAGFVFQVLYTPGHTVGGCCYYCRRGAGAVFRRYTVSWQCRPDGFSDGQHGDAA